MGLALVLTLVVSATVVAQSQQQPQNQPQAQPAQQQPAADIRGAQPPLRIEVLPAPQTPQEAADAKYEREDERWARRWMVYTGIVTVLILFFQLIYYGLQISKMSKIAAGQNADMRASIAEATKSAKAMKVVALTLTESTRAVQETVRVTKEMAETQSFVFELSNRAWLSVTFDGMSPQRAADNLYFAPRIRITNRGATPAYDIQVFLGADVLPFPLDPNFGFPLPPPTFGSRVSVLGPSLDTGAGAYVPRLLSEQEEAEVRAGDTQRIVLWGSITYRDAFKKNRFVKFSYTYYVMPDRTWLSQDTGLHSDSD